MALGTFMFLKSFTFLPVIESSFDECGLSFERDLQINDIKVLEIA